MTKPIHLDEADARRVLLLQAFETGAGGSGDDNPQWTLDDRAWASRLARETLPAAARPAQVLAERARHAMQRLAPRDAAVRRLQDGRGWRPAWALLALFGGLLCGVAVDAIGGTQHINLLAPPVWAVIAWNLLIYLALLLPFALPLPWSGPLRRGLAGRLTGLAGLAGMGRSAAAAASPLVRFRQNWLLKAKPLLASRAALLLHLAAAALGAGLVGGLYLRGLVLDYRAGWQSSFLDAEQVHAALSLLLAPAVGLTGISVPDVAALAALQTAANALPPVTEATRAAPWIHLYAAMLVLLVVLPRSLLAMAAAARGGYLSRRLPLSLDEPYFQRLLRESGQQVAHVQLLPHGAAPSPHALACLRTVLAGALGAGLQISVAPATAYGDEDGAGALAPGADTSLRVALLDLSATPEDDSHGAFVRALRAAAPALPLLVLADETAFRARFASLPARIAERRTAWQNWARAAKVGFLSVDLAQPDTAAAERGLQTALAVA